jgi:integrase
MAKDLTAKRLEAIRSSRETRSEPDGAIGGLAVRWGAKARPSFTLIYRCGGKQRRVKLGPWWNGKGEKPPGFLTLQEARQRAVRIKADAAQGIDVKVHGRGALPAGTPTLANVVEHFIRQHASKKRSGTETARILHKELVDPLGSRPIASITRGDLRLVFDTIAERAGVMANRTFQIARRLFSWCVERGYLDASPMEGMKRPTDTEASRDRVLSDAELTKVWRAVDDGDDSRRDIIRMLILTGCRRTETALMRWSDVNFDQREWTIPASMSKNGMAHTVYLSDQALAILGQRAREGELVFGDRRPITHSENFRKLAQKLGTDVRLHDLRRTFASGLQRLGTQPVIIDKLLNHSSVVKGIAAIYMRAAYAKERREATELWGQHVEGIIRKEVNNG